MLLPKPSADSPPMFASRVLDAFSRTHYLIVAYVYVPIVLGLFAYGVWLGNVGILQGFALFMGGLVVWTLTEYWLHRLLFHWQPKTSWGPKLHFTLHGVHHQLPRDRYRLVLPPTVSFPLFVGFGLIFWSVLGAKVWLFHAGFTLGYMTYDLMHYYLHHGKVKHRLLHKLQGHHMSHHFNRRYADRRYGVSSPIWDWVFRTN